MKTGLVLEGGAMRGMYTAGALDVLLENDINFDGIIGTSAGAVFGVEFPVEAGRQGHPLQLPFQRRQELHGDKAVT